MVVARSIVLGLLVSVLVGALGCSRTPSTSPTVAAPILSVDEALQGFRADLISALAGLDPNAGDHAIDEKLRSELASLTDKYAPSLRPAAGSKKYVSVEQDFVLVIAANGVNGNKGEDASAADEQAQLVVAVGGDGSPAPRGGGAGGGSASAHAPRGVAVALGGRGGHGRAGGGGGGSSATGGGGSISLGGEGGKGSSGASDGGSGGGSGIVHAKDIIEAVSRLARP